MYQYQLKPSLLQLRFNLGVYCLSFLTLLSYSSMYYLTILLCVLIILLAFIEWKGYRQTKHAAPEILSLNSGSGTLEWRKNNNICQFTVYSVYTCRWGMILVSRQSGFRNSLILLADRFDNNSQYLDLRFRLIHLNQVMHAS